MLIALLVVSLILLAAAFALPQVVAAPPAFWAHGILAVGVMSLIPAAMQHFVPVLARGQGASPRMTRLPLLMMAAGVVASLALLGVVPFAAIGGAAGLALLGLAILLGWIVRKGRQAVGRPHPGLGWYVAALVCLALGLAAALLIPLWPQGHAALRAFHLHINLYGFVGLTAIGTLQVLLPTATGRPDPEVATRLKRDLKWAVAGSLALAAGQAVDARWLALAGALCWTWPLARLVHAWWRQQRPAIFTLHGAAPILAVAAIGFACALTAVVAGQAAPLAIFLPGFLMPLIVGAASQLAPVFLRPGVATDWHTRSRAWLGRWSGLRALLFLTAAILPLFSLQCVGIPALLGLLWFGAVFALWLLQE